MPAFKFPSPKDRTPNKPAVFCTAERVINLFNQSNTNSAKRISQKVREWFFTEAHKNGWSGVHFVPEALSQHGAGCMLWVEQDRTSIRVTKAVLVLVSGTDD